jgi:hypothetical protein
MATTIAPGVLVEHTVWGLGKALDVQPPYVTAHFPSLQETPQGPVRKLQLAAPQLSLSAVQSDPVFDRVSLPSKERKTSRQPKRPPRPVVAVHTLEQLMAWFETAFPGRFADERLMRDEIAPRRLAHDLFVARFGEGRGARLLEAASHDLIADGLKDLYRATNISSRFEAKAATEGLNDGAAAARVLEALLALLHAPDAASFDALVTAVGALPVPAAGSRVLTWPNVTVLPFLADPTRFMALKPDISKLTAARLGVDLAYSSPPTWRTYETLLAMSADLLARLAPLGARDYIDAQSFLWVTRDLD